jgi:RHS repeat-associated protein
LTTKRYEYIYGVGGKLAKVEYEGDVLEAQVYYYHNDLLGSPICVTDIDGNVAWKGDYLPFGEPLQDIDTIYWGNAYTYLGNEDDGGLMYFHARYYAKELGRFMSCDPIKDMASSALTINPYIYCGNNPVVFTDPLGLKAPGPIANPDAGEDTGHFGGTWISSWSIYSQGAYQGALTATNMAFTKVDALMDSMGLNEGADDPILIITDSRIWDNNEEYGLKDAAKAAQDGWEGKIEVSVISQWSDLTEGNLKYAIGDKAGQTINQEFDNAVLILHGVKGEIYCNGDKGSIIDIAKGMIPYFKPVGDRELVVYACSQYLSRWRYAMTRAGGEDINVWSTDIASSFSPLDKYVCLDFSFSVNGEPPPRNRPDWENERVLTSDGYESYYSDRYGYQSGGWNLYYTIYNWLEGE